MSTIGILRHCEQFYFLQEEHLDLVSLGSSVEEEDSPLAFLEKVYLFRERVEKFTRRPLPSVLSLSVTPRAPEYLQQHWPSVTIGSLEEAPVPKVCSCAKCGSVWAGAETEGGEDPSDGRLQDLQPELRLTSPVVLFVLLLLLLLVVLWINPGGGASLCFSLVSRFGQLVHGLGSELITAVADTAGSAYVAMEVAVEGWRSDFSSGFQQLVLLFKTLTSR